MTNSQHYVRQPAFLFFIRIAQILLSIIILGLAAYGIDYSKTTYGAYVVQYIIKDGATDQSEAAFGFAIFVVIYTWIAVGYNLAGSTFFVALWNCWAVLALEIVAVVFWLVAFALLGAWASDHVSMSKKDGGLGLGNFDDSSFGDSSLPSVGDLTNWITKRSTISSESKKAKGVWQSGAAASGLGAIVWVLFIITLVVYAISLQRHRTDPENQNLPADGSPLPDEAHDPNYELKQQSQGYAPQQPA